MTAADNSKSARPVSATQLPAIRRCAFDIEPPIGEIGLCHAALPQRTPSWMRLRRLSRALLQLDPQVRTRPVPTRIDAIDPEPPFKSQTRDSANKPR